MIVPTSNGQTGLAGEHATTAALLRRGWAAAMVHGHSPGIDILAAKGDRTIQVQVKTSLTFKTGFPLKQAMLKPHVFYICVILEEERTVFYVVPGSQIDAVYYRSPCGILGQIRPKNLEPFRGAWQRLEQQSEGLMPQDLGALGAL